MLPKLSKPVLVAPVVDTHLHVFEAGHALPGARYTPTYAATLAAWQAQATRVAVTHGVLVQTSFMGTDNSLLLAQLARHPDTLRGVAVIAPTADAGVLAFLHAQGVRGIRLNLAGQSHDVSDWATASTLWDAILQLGWHVELHTDSGALPDVMAALPHALPVVADHFGKPAQTSINDATVAALRRHSHSGGNVNVKLSAAYRLDPHVNPQLLARLWLAELGPNALLWGSDWPCTNHETQADYAALYAALDEWLGREGDAVVAARSTNPKRLYWRN